ncbi:FAD/NAD(P)-binding domain-containing protein [Pseudovirgaria hyperparasitica]|uniref:FAD/NAD(P)-binding domain-containing protein n=1 Tax=Pseudovirgaria hyperparasitica TaxID=470096 RepID=A0A6A6WJ85_9PEZI|nr:FAD/NAD(P)-binding domain-containing protein [Pseudovirgaria hyperparasitica]KAF2762459.1 FAD/NAD(P)-binding domain-containing protein [Pseudovirgaria hyperparasitica]
MTTPKLNVLIVGGGIAGPAFAYWLHRATPCTITILERFPAPRTSGQAVDIRGVSVDIVRKMGILPTIKSLNTSESGMQVIDVSGAVKASFPVSGDDKNQGPTSEYEIMRGDLARILLDISKDHAQYVYDESVKTIEESDNGKVHVEFTNAHLPPSDYDLVVAADGMLSRTRRAVFGRGPNNKDYLHHLGEYLAYFTIPSIPSDDSWSQWLSFGRGLLAFKRPDRDNNARIFLGVADKPTAERFKAFETAVHEGRDAQEALLRKEFAGAGWQMERFLGEMSKSDDFYFQIVAQTKIEHFTKGRIALLGDAGYCPSPISGMGTAAAITGAYVLAGEISKNPEDIKEALASYERVLRPFVDEVQWLIPGAPQLAVPQSDWAVKIFNTVMGLASSKPVQRLMGYVLPAAGKRGWQLPVYEKFEESPGIGDDEKV